MMASILGNLQYKGLLIEEKDLQQGGINYTNRQTRDRLECHFRVSSDQG